MSNSPKPSNSGWKIFKILIILVFAVLLVFSIYGLAVYKGWVPIPELATNILAKQKGLTETEAKNLNKIVNLDHIVQQSDNADEFSELQQLIVNGASRDDLIKFTIDNYDNISDETWRSMATQMGISDQDFVASQNILEEALNKFKQSGKISIGDSDKEVLKVIQNKYGLTKELFQKLIKSNVGFNNRKILCRKRK